MKPFPHEYSVNAISEKTGSVELVAEGLPKLSTAPPMEFGGPGDQWSPESLFVGALADCFILTFRAIARASRLEWTRLQCRTHGTVDRSDGVTRFVAIRIEADLTLPPSSDLDSGRRLLEKAERSCLVSRSLNLSPELEARVARA